MKYFIFLSAIIFFNSTAYAQINDKEPGVKIIPAAERTQTYFPLLKGKNVAVFANQTSTIGNVHLVDSLLKAGIQVVKIFGPEHGFRGKAGAGESVASGKDIQTGLPVVSLYGKKKKPTKEDLKGVDVMLFDIQDVGVRFYTYISSLQYFMEAAFENGIPMLLLDRPNPNGHYVDGPVLEKEFASFIGMQPVPVVYGMTIGEYALMIAGESWLSDAANKKYAYYKNATQTTDTPFHFLVIKCAGYDHTKEYVLPVAPSPNLQGKNHIRIYPTTGFFEGTVLSEGRGTPEPFLYVGHPQLPNNLFSFTPKPTPGAPNSKCYYQKCYGWNFINETENNRPKQIQLNYIIRAYQAFPGKDSFFLKNNFFDKLAGNNKLMQQIKKGMSEEQIRKSWQSDLLTFKTIRKKYLLYKDFE